MKNKSILGRTIYNHNTIDKLESKIKKLGINNRYDVIYFMNMRIITTIIVFFIILYLFDLGYILAPIISLVYYFFYEKFLVDEQLKRRAVKLDDEAMYFFEVLTLSLETGRNLEEAINVSVKNIDSELSDEFRRAMREIRFGKSLNESLVDMQSYIPSDTINNIILTLTQGDIYGSSIINTLNNHIDYLREKQKLDVKAEITKMPIKISVISVLFFVPLVLMIILGPVILQYLG